MGTDSVSSWSNASGFCHEMRIGWLVILAFVTAGCAPEPSPSNTSAPPVPTTAPAGSQQIDTPFGTAFLLEHSSASATGEEVEVTSLVYRPESADETTPVVAFAHGTTGLADQCAPSNLIREGGLGDFFLVAPLIDQGWIVVATDYQGLGTPGPHPFLVNLAAGQDLLASVVAAREAGLVGPDAPVAMFGFSQGGGAVAVAAEIAGAYAPSLDLVGAVAVAPATELSEFGISGDGDPALGLMVIYGYAAAYPDLDPAAVLSDRGIERLEEVESGCLNDLRRALADIAPGDLIGEGIGGDAAWQAALDANTPGTRPTDIPIVIVHGGEDTTVPPEASVAYQRRACATGTEVGRVEYPGVNHLEVLVATDAADSIVGWLETWYSGGEAGPGCPSS